MKDLTCLRRLLLVLATVCVAGGLAAEDPPRVRLLTAHVDIATVYQPDDPTNRLAVVVRDDDHGVRYRSNEVALVAIEAAKLSLPPGTIFGDEGAPFWVLPQSQNPVLLYLGLSGEDLPPGLFGTEIALRLLAISGPGDFFLWQAGAFGEFELRMNSRGGLTDEDQVQVVPSSHAHWNWGFTTNGTYELVLQASARRVGVETNDISLPTALRFEVEPLPPEPESPFAAWQKEHWPGVTDPAVIGPTADPDQDGIANVVEYALGLDPKAADPSGWPVPVVLEKGLERWTELHFRTPRTATDVSFHCWRSSTLTAPIWEALPGPELSGQPAPEGLVAMAFMGGTVTESRPVYLRLEVWLAPSSP